NFLTALPFGVMAMSKDIEGLVETSLNLGIIKLENSSVSLSISVRSNVDEEKDELINSLKEIADNNNTSYSVRGEYPGWAYKSDSPLREKMVRIYEEMYGEKPEVQALHAGLECGVFAYKIKDLDCISFGPNMYDIHSTKERMSLSSAERTWKFLLKVLSE
ncbi:MAG: M20/M25/M40 family metallo-hydrolase, partial [Lachnospiraceae bacterium]|nr:M20/M25/M40 family metallo-hydrolase [Lachnospiraceae bacterium]